MIGRPVLLINLLTEWYNLFLFYNILVRTYHYNPNFTAEYMTVT